MSLIGTLSLFCLTGFCTKGIPPVKWPVSLLWSACLCGWADLCGGASLPQGVFSLWRLWLRLAPGSACLWFWTGCVSSTVTSFSCLFNRVSFSKYVHISLKYYTVVSHRLWNAWYCSNNNNNNRCYLSGKLYCKLHFAQRKNGTSLPKSFNKHSVSAPEHPLIDLLVHYSLIPVI